MCSPSLCLSLSLSAFLTVACQPQNKPYLRGTFIEMFIECLFLSHCCFSLPVFLSHSHSCSLMCKHVCSLNPLCIPFVVNVVVPYCLITRTVFTNAGRQLDNSILLFEAVYRKLLLWFKKRGPGKTSMFCVVVVGVFFIFMPQLDVQ